MQKNVDEERDLRSSMDEGDEGMGLLVLSNKENILYDEETIGYSSMECLMSRSSRLN